jgi:GTPase SAR1 family protein
MRKIIVLQGVSNVGKTTKINKIVEWLIHTRGAVNTVGFDPTNLEKNIHGVLTINNFTIGINAAGDNIDHVKRVDTLKNVHGDSPDVIICAARTKGAGVEYLRNNFDPSTGWLYVLKVVFDESTPAKQQIRDTIILDELKAHLRGI